jgi:glycosyltransferase involved in cell wall biosynthesis
VPQRGVPSRLTEHENLTFIWGTSAWRWNRWCSRTRLTSSLRDSCTAVAAQAADRPVIAAAAGGALETVLDGATGLLARPDDVDSFAGAIAGIDGLDFEPARAVEHAESFSVASFQRRLADLVSSRVRERRGPA